MNTEIDETLLSVPFGQANQSVNTARYLWDNSRRGGGPFVILQWTFEGTGVFAAGGKERFVTAGEAFIAIVPEASVYWFPRRATEPWTFAWINLYGPLAISLLHAFRKSFGAVVSLPRRTVAGGMFLRLAELAERRAFPDAYEASAATYAFLMDWTRQLTRPTGEGRDPVKTAAALCRARYREPIGIKELAAETGLTREHLTRIFTTRIGLSPGRYLRNLRIVAARQMLLAQEIPRKEIALRCGFPSVRSLNQALDAKHLKHVAQPNGGGPVVRVNGLD